VKRMVAESRLFVSVVDAICQSFVMSLLINISLCDMTPPLGAIALWSASIGVDYLVLSRLILQGKYRSRGSDSPSI